MSQVELLRAAVALLDKAGIPYMVVGSYASAFHGEPRMTRDIDVVIEPNSDSIKLLVDLVDRDRFYIGDAEAAFRSCSMFNLIEPSSGWKVDFVIRKDRAFSHTEFARRFPVRVAGVDVYMASAEDTMLAKLEWGKASGSERQLEDVVAIAANQDVDRTYLHRWAQNLQLEAELDAALRASQQGRSDRSPVLQLERWSLWAKTVLLGDVEVLEVDMPWKRGNWHPTSAFGEFADRFRQSRELLLGDDFDAWEQVDRSLRADGVHMRYPSGAAVPEWLLHIEGEAAWFRWNDEPFIVQ